jgi:hypothetical protein
VTVPTCAKCNGQRFQLQRFTPDDSAFELNSVQCSNCGAPVAVIDLYNIGGRLAELEAKIDKIMKKVGA